MTMFWILCLPPSKDDVEVQAVIIHMLLVLWLLIIYFSEYFYFLIFMKLPPIIF